MAQGEWLFTVVANQEAWQYASNVEIGEGETAILRASGSWGVIDPRNRGNCGPAGNGVNGTGDIVAPGKPEGSLLCKTADGNVSAFPASCVLTTSIPGYVYFIANDYTSTGAGFSDNNGSLLVDFVIQQAHSASKKQKLNSTKQMDQLFQIKNVLKVE